MTLTQVIELVEEIVISHLEIDFWAGDGENLQEDPYNLPLLHLDPPTQNASTNQWTLQCAILYRLEEGHNQARTTQLQSTAAIKANKFIDGIDHEYNDINGYLDTAEVTNSPQIIMVPDFNYSGTLVAGCRFEVVLSVTDITTC